MNVVAPGDARDVRPAVSVACVTFLRIAFGRPIGPAPEAAQIESTIERMASSSLGAVRAPGP